MKMVLLLYFLMTSGEAVEAFEADNLNDLSITAFHDSEYKQAF